MSAFKDSGHWWWQKCETCDMAWFIGERPADGADAEAECERCVARVDEVAAVEKRARAEGFRAARERAADAMQALSTEFLGEGWGQSALRVREAAARIRAMEDDAGEGGAAAETSRETRGEVQRAYGVFRLYLGRDDVPAWERLPRHEQEAWDAAISTTKEQR